MQKVLALLGLVSALFVATQVTATDVQPVTVALKSVADSGVTGKVHLEPLPQGGTNISLKAEGLKAGEEYVSLYYTNHVCALTLPFEDEVIGVYTANASGIGMTQRQINGQLAEVNSVSVRRAFDFSLVACADVHPNAYPPPYP